jgi:glutamate-5-semialdehyde dehydrogenase
MQSLSNEEKNKALLEMAKALEKNASWILEENQLDVTQAREKGLSNAMVDRLRLDEDRIASMASGLRDIARLTDPVGECLEGWVQKDGLEIVKKRVPIGVLLMIYESRPNVTADSAALAIKSGNVIILRGGSEANHTNQAIAAALIAAGESAGLPEGAIQMVKFTERDVLNALLRCDHAIDVVIPRGGKGLKAAILEHATIPVIVTGSGVCHLFVDESADLERAALIAVNAKTQRPGVCNAIETLLLHENLPDQGVKEILDALKAKGVALYGCERAIARYEGFERQAVEEDWEIEYLDLELAVRMVSTMEEAVDHIERYGSKHSESILTGSYAVAEKFTREVDAACVYVNASTRFTDGAEFGFGGEIGISTQKLHARGPMGLKELTTYKYVIRGNGQIRG